MRALHHIALALCLAGAVVAAVATGAGPAAAQQGRGTLTIEPGGGQLVTLPQAAATVFAADPRVARVQAASPTTLFISGVGRGRTVVVATAADGSEIASYEVTVGPPPRPPGAPGPAVAAAPALPALEAAIRSIVPGGSNISVRRVPGGVMLSGEVPTAADAQRAFTVARSGLPEGERVIDQLRIGGALQVNLRVRVAEVSRTITRDLGFNWQALGNTGRFAFGLLTGTFAGARLIPGLGGEAGRNFIAGGYSSSSFDINGLIDALAQDQLISILAEPNLTAQSGETASFLAGGEFPVPVGTSQGTSITIEFKQFGVSLAFVPTVLDATRISLKVRPEVSELTEEGAISLPVAGGVVRIPALRVRRAETTVELGSGQSFAIAGLLQDGSRIASSGLPFLGEIPILGALFKSDRFRRNDSELVIIVTPYLVRPVSDPGRLALPTDGVRPANDIERILFHRQLSREAAPPRVPGQIGFIVE
ncbi:type II and III secretion system protein family protein [Elioraea tepidiphila]|jgi:pilus assembly protein CpaC|uniref:type II and III secretion system protein family protein n=1 Tax=Elioraea tepidiphila TaxID=457934 RepID=UPI000686EC93|nr:type II and III secretion system protein family protein [Elioraea tepidiphila]